ncbi:LOW QUALITY PROTEIN: N-acetylglucosamine-1-phosphodiester alpha-N-acetylglucosaminidase-like [Haliotis rubra]|uniref:LOW QUALITY PROTEIN: N-acetylglucosamine-1-phosphodiester alpha-N-acetylglucosaminidase-like n=1 Tax=Haliotis rubra TaxID=36100 RepID=UPI001EE5B2C8|nr:LOW QUALITY PROTEIN: N-acetylglucosamine-1-phosphodiester alpha-N-acetylglucosaminidase-like [Haliotis rubra]
MTIVFRLVTLALIGVSVQICSGQKVIDDGMDLLQPYLSRHGGRRTHREVRDCQHIKYGNLTHSKHKAHSSVNLTLPLVESRHQLKSIGEYYYNKRTVTVLFQKVNNPVKTFSVLEPGTPGTCLNGSAERATVRESAKQKHCILATNAGFFNTHTGECYGNIYSDGRLVGDSDGVQNAHFGVTADGYIYVGYLSELDLLTQHFTQLVGGVLWILREGEIYVDESVKIECSDTEETGTLREFATVKSARVAVGHDKDGRILIAQVDGKTGSLGVDLQEMASILLDLGFVNAINLDGGGSATTVINSTLVSHPSDLCPDKMFNCERRVSTILCVHDPDCDPEDCSGHGSCELGVCNCTGHWSGRACDRLQCPQDCNGHGTCTSDGCVCDKGWYSTNCSLPCPAGRYGFNCSMQCCCQNGGLCDSVTGHCGCSPGFAGEFCQSACPYGFYGARCASVCNCDTSCFCDHITGSCNSTGKQTSQIFHNYQQAGSCMAQEMIKSQHLVVDQSDQYRLCVSSSVTLGIIAAVSIIINITLLSIYLNVRRRQASDTDEAVKKTIRKFVLHGSTDDYSCSDGEGTGELTTLFQTPPRKGNG